MYDDDDHQQPPRSGFNDRGYRRRSPYPQHRSRHGEESSRSPPAGQRVDESGLEWAPDRERDRERDREWDRGNRSSDRQRGRGYGREGGRGDNRYRYGDYGPDSGSPDRCGDRDRDWDRDRNRDRDRGYGGREDRGYGRHSPRDHLSADEYGDDYHHREPGSYRSGPGAPYHTIKMDDIPAHLSVQEIESLLRKMGATGLVEVRMKKQEDRSGYRCYAFAEFQSDEDSVAFLESHYPALRLNGVERDGGNARVPIAYSRERRLAPGPDDWVCTLCHYENFSRRATCKQCKAPRTAEGAADMQLDGKSDECPQQTPSPFLVIRDLPSGVSESSLATAIKKLYVVKEEEPKASAGSAPKLKSTAPVGNTSGLGAKPGSLIRVMVIREKHTDVSCRYGFAEFATVDDARAAMAKFNATPQFTIASKPVTIAYIHSGVFIPHLAIVTDADGKFSFTATHNPTLRLSYWNPSVYPNELSVFDESLYGETATAEGTAAADLAAAKDSKKRKAEKELGGVGKKTVAMAPQLQRWADKHAELRGAAAKQAKEEAASTEQLAPTTGSNSLAFSKGTSRPPSPPAKAVSYADLDRMCCLLCRRRFVSEASLRRHEQLSDMHKGKLEDDVSIEAAVQDLKAHGKEPTTNYRDRAKERRLLNNQPTKPKPQVARKGGQKAKDGQSNPKESTAAAVSPIGTVSKGAGLLAKMGWSAGTGLGADGGGRTSIIETTAYAPGVGLGAEGGKIGDAVEEAARATTNDYSDFVAKAKDKARQRYEKME